MNKRVQDFRAADGFTLIELLVVILIVGILSAIAIPSFIAQKSKGQDACAKSMVRTMETAMESYATDHNGGYNGADMTELNRIESSITDNKCGGATLMVAGHVSSSGACDSTAPQDDGYCVQTTSASSNIFSVTRGSTGRITRECVRNEPRGACLGSGASGTW